MDKIKYILMASILLLSVIIMVCFSYDQKKPATNVLVPSFKGELMADLLEEFSYVPISRSGFNITSKNKSTENESLESILNSNSKVVVSKEKTFYDLIVYLSMKNSIPTKETIKLLKVKKDEGLFEVKKNIFEINQDYDYYISKDYETLWLLNKESHYMANLNNDYTSFYTTGYLAIQNRNSKTYTFGDYSSETISRMMYHITPQVKRIFYRKRLLTTGNGDEDFLSYLILLVITALVGLNIVSRTKEVKIKYLLSYMILLLIFWIIARVLKYHSERIGYIYLWYAFYIPRILIPNIALLITFEITKSTTKTNKIIHLLHLIFAINLIVLFMTNNFHQLAFKFTYSFISIRYSSVAIVYYIAIVYIISTYIYCYFRLYKYANERKKHLYIIMTTIHFVVFSLYIIGYNMRVPILLESEITRVSIISILIFLELIISSGLIESDPSYKTMFLKTSIPMFLFNKDDEIVISNSPVSYESEKNKRYSSKEILGGKVVWRVDIKKIKELELQLEKTSKNLTAKINLLNKLIRLSKEKQYSSYRLNILNQVNENIDANLREVYRLCENIETIEGKELHDSLQAIEIDLIFVKRISLLIINHMGETKLNMQNIPSELLIIQNHIGSGLDYVPLIVGDRDITLENSIFVLKILNTIIKMASATEKSSLISIFNAHESRKLITIKLGLPKDNIKDFVEKLNVENLLMKEGCQIKSEYETNELHLDILEVYS